MFWKEEKAVEVDIDDEAFPAIEEGGVTLPDESKLSFPADGKRRKSDFSSLAISAPRKSSFAPRPRIKHKTFVAGHNRCAFAAITHYFAAAQH